MWLVGVVIRRYIDILIIIINFPYSTCIRSFFGSSILTSLFIFKMFFRSLIYKTIEIIIYRTIEIIIYRTIEIIIYRTIEIIIYRTIEIIIYRTIEIII